MTLQLWVGYFKHLLLICELHSWIFKISAAVIDPSTMGRLFLAFIINMWSSPMDILKCSNNISAAVFDHSTMGSLFLAFIVNMGASLRLLVFR